MYKSYHVPATKMQVYSAITLLPWAVKPIIGLIVEIFPVRGYSRAPAAILTSLAGTLAFAVIGFMPQHALTVTPLVICLFLQSLQVSTADTITQGIVTAKVQEMPVARLRTDLLAFVWSGGDVGALIAVFTSGMVISWLGP